MSLINKALKLEQQRRQTNNHAPAPPMVAHMARQGRQNNVAVILAAFTGIGLIIAVVIAATLHFGSDYLEGKGGTLAKSPNTHDSSLSDRAETITSADTSKSANSSKSKAQQKSELSPVQQMLVDRSEESKPPELKPSAENPTVSPAQETTTSAPLAKTVHLQDIVDNYSIQGIRKAGKDTRVFLNGRIRRIGEVIDLEHGLKIVGFTEDYLIFRASDGQSYKKAI